MHFADHFGQTPSCGFQREGHDGQAARICGEPRLEKIVRVEVQNRAEGIGRKDEETGTALDEKEPAIRTETEMQVDLAKSSFELLLGEDVMQAHSGPGALVRKPLRVKGPAREEQREERDDNGQDSLRGQRVSS